jgi:hypothetical protein
MPVTAKIGPTLLPGDAAYAAAVESGGAELFGSLIAGLRGEVNAQSPAAATVSVSQAPPSTVIPAQAGIQPAVVDAPPYAGQSLDAVWIPACAGLTGEVAEGEDQPDTPAQPSPPAEIASSTSPTAVSESVEQLLALVRPPDQVQPTPAVVAPPGPPDPPGEGVVTEQASDLEPSPAAFAPAAPIKPTQVAKPTAAEAAQIDLPVPERKQAPAPTPAAPAPAPAPAAPAPALVTAQQVLPARPARALLERVFTPIDLSSGESATEPLPIAGWTKLVGAAPVSAEAVMTQLAPAQPLASFQAQATTAPVPAEILVEHQLDLAADGAWLDQLAKDIAAAGEDGAPLRFRLNPETLGSLRVEVTQQRDGAAIRLTADTEAARAIIADAQPKLLAEARAQGVRISETHVDLGQGSASGDPRRQQASPDEPQLRTARSLQDDDQSDGNPTERRSDRFA